MRVIAIEVHGPNDYTVREIDRSCDQLCWDEMIGTIAEITHPKIGEARYRMRTREERAAYESWLRGNRHPVHAKPPLLPAPKATSAEDDLLKVAHDFEEVLGELHLLCNCGRPDCRTTRLRAAIAKAKGAA